MIARAGSGWQTVLADLSLILFIVMASAVSEAPASPPPVQQPAILPALGDPVALWREGPGSPPLKDWLVSAAPDPRLRLTIMAPAAQARAALLLAEQAGRPARILIDPAATALVAALTYDQPPVLAQGLQQAALKETNP